MDFHDISQRSLGNLSGVHINITGIVILPFLNPCGLYHPTFKCRFPGTDLEQFAILSRILGFTFTLKPFHLNYSYSHRWAMKKTIGAKNSQVQTSPNLFKHGLRPRPTTGPSQFQISRQSAAKKYRSYWHEDDIEYSDTVHYYEAALLVRKNYNVLLTSFWFVRAYNISVWCVIFALGVSVTILRPIKMKDISSEKSPVDYVMTIWLRVVTNTVRFFGLILSQRNESNRTLTTRFKKSSNFLHLRHFTIGLSLLVSLTYNADFSSLIHTVLPKQPQKDAIRVLESVLTGKYVMFIPCRRWAPDPICVKYYHRWIKNTFNPSVHVMVDRIIANERMYKIGVWGYNVSQLSLVAHEFSRDQRLVLLGSKMRLEKTATRSSAAQLLESVDCPPSLKSDFRFVFAKGSPLVPHFNHAIRILRSSNWLYRIEKKYKLEQRRLNLKRQNRVRATNLVSNTDLISMQQILIVFHAFKYPFTAASIHLFLERYGRAMVIGVHNMVLLDYYFFL